MRKVFAAIAVACLMLVLGAGTAFAGNNDPTTGNGIPGRGGNDGRSCAQVIALIRALTVEVNHHSSSIGNSQHQGNSNNGQYNGNGNNGRGNVREDVTTSKKTTTTESSRGNGNGRGNDNSDRRQLAEKKAQLARLLIEKRRLCDGHEDHTKTHTTTTTTATETNTVTQTTTTEAPATTITTEVQGGGTTTIVIPAQITPVTVFEQTVPSGGVNTGGA